MLVPFGFLRVFRQITSIGFCLLAGASALSGCTASPSALSPSLASARTHSVSVRSRPDYRRAEKLYQEGKREESRALLVALQKSPGLSPADTEFLNRQIAIVASPASESVAPPTRKRVPDDGISSKAVSTAVPADCGPRALKIAAEAMGVKSEVPKLVEVAGTDKDGTSLEGLVRAAKSLGLKGEGIQVDRDALAQVSTPAVVWYDGNHYVALLKISTNPLTGSVSTRIHDPNEGVEKTLPLEELLSRSGGIVLTLKKK